ncbi:hypothetical protein I4F81_002920 [Pyropia yezoensis]|uniref:Uncharacterized protein n=1 Tax=Pyropia yezoensis TaxID=2788 RepID=A0ACC3BSD7_PYRYE|nr:hypothetical protein I4F81_002920 [Neopyropia yezoensis]
MEDYIPDEEAVDGGDGGGGGGSSLDARLAAAEAEAAAALAAGIPPLLAGMDVAAVEGFEFDATDEADEDEADLPPWDESVPALNSVFLTGRAGKDPVTREFPSGARLTSFTLAVPRDNFGQAAAEAGASAATWRAVADTTDWFDIDAWGRLAERVERVVRKGGRLAVAGELDIQEWVDATTGELRSRPLIVLSEVEALDGRGGGGGGRPPPSQSRARGRARRPAAAAAMAAAAAAAAMAAAAAAAAMAAVAAATVAAPVAPAAPAAMGSRRGGGRPGHRPLRRRRRGGRMARRSGRRGRRQRPAPPPAGPALARGRRPPRRRRRRPPTRRQGVGGAALAASAGGSRGRTCPRFDCPPRAP